MYYLQSRYYDPAVGRFINADVVDTILSEKSSLQGNLFAYCNNNPVNLIDIYGNIIAVIAARVILGIMLGIFIQLLCDLILYWYDVTTSPNSESNMKCNPGDYIASMITWSTAFISINSKFLSIAATIVPFLVKHLGRLINKTFDCGTFLIDFASVIFSVVISFLLGYSEKNKLSKIAKKFKNVKNATDKLSKAEQKIKLAFSKLGIKFTVCINIGNVLIQTIYDLVSISIRNKQFS